MNDLKVFESNGVQVVDSRDVARMVERDHCELLKTIRIYSRYLGEGNFAESDFFIPSTYANAQNKEQPCYLLTQRGCDMIANKMTGPKGIMFTATYVDAFHRMQEQIQSQLIKPMTQAEILAAQSQILVDMERKFAETESRVLAISDKVDKALLAFSKPAENHWVADMKTAVKEICERYQQSMPNLLGRIYEELERTAKASLESRLSRLKERLKKQGVPYKERNAVTKLEVIERDAQLRAIFEAILRRYQAVYCEKQE